MLCLNFSCQCEHHEYFYEPTLQCLNKSNFMEPCKSSKSCRVDLGLECRENKCQCNSEIKFWSFPKNKCEDFYGYGQLGCSSDDNCDKGLICNLYPDKNNCSCPILSKYGMCDCERNENEDIYWNGKNCANKLNTFSKCNFDYECKKPNVCLHKLSFCSPEFFLSSLLRNCALKKNNFVIINIIFIIFVLELIKNF